MVWEFSSVQLDSSVKQFSLFMRYRFDREEEEPPTIQIQTICQREVPDSVRDNLNWEDTSPEERQSAPSEEYIEYIKQLNAEIDLLATDLFNLARWRCGIRGGPISLVSDWRYMRWHRQDGSELLANDWWLNRQIVASVFPISLPHFQQIQVNDDIRSAITQEFDQDTHQPLYHDLFREAWQNQNGNPRSSLVMGVAAAETAIKTAMTDLNPSLTWLVENLQSPPLDKMLRDYMCQLPARCTFDGRVRRLPKRLINLIRKGVESRNRLVHGRGTTISKDDLRETLHAVSDLLYLLDYYRGEEWALERISPAVLSAIRAGTA